MCLTKLCWHIDQPGWADPEAAQLGAYRNGNIVVVVEGERLESHTEDAFRTFMAYRVLWKYLGLPKPLLEALSDATGRTVVRDGASYEFSSHQAQTGAPFTVV